MCKNISFLCSDYVEKAEAAYQSHLLKMELNNECQFTFNCVLVIFSYTLCMFFLKFLLIKMS